MNNTKMTLTERNQKLCELRSKMNKLKAELAWVEQEIWLVKDQYEKQELDLFKEMFGESVKVPSIYTDTPMAEEVYGG
jgi:DNA helicase IV